MKLKKRGPIILAICFALLLVSGQQGCEMPGFSPGGQAKESGVDFNLISEINYLTSGKILDLGETFFVGIKITNYDKQARSGTICIRDSLADTFGGISSDGRGECRPFNVKAAETIKQESKGFFGSESEQLTPGITEVYFPNDAEYSYKDLPVMQKPYPGKLFISVSYSEETKASGVVVVPGSKQPAITQDPAPISVAVSKSVHPMHEAYKVSLDILLRKQQQQARIFSHDFSRENVTFFDAKLTPHTMECKTTDGKSVSGLVEFENERLIKCSSLIYLTGKEESYPLIIMLSYGVALEKSYSFSIKTKEI